MCKGCNVSFGKVFHAPKGQASNQESIGVNKLLWELYSGYGTINIAEILFRGKTM